MNRRGLLLLTALGLCCAMAVSCSKGPGTSAKQIPREGDAQLVVYVDTPGQELVEFADEVEPNDEPGQASPVVMGSGVHGTLDGERDKDLYKVVADRAGHLRATVSGIEGVDLILELMDQDGQVLAVSDRGPATTVEGVANYPVAESAVYYVAVREFVKKRPPPKRQNKNKRRSKKNKNKQPDPEPEGRVGPSPVYDLVVQWREQPALRHENERNETLDTANELLLGDDGFGYVGWANDVDVWKLSLEGFTAHYGLNMDLDGVPGVTFKLVVYDPRGKKVLTRKGDKETGLSIRNLVVVDDEQDAAAEPESLEVEPGEAAPGPAPRDDADAAGYYYARLSARRSNPVDAYRLRMSTHLLEAEDEIEPNDEPGQAMVVEVSPDGSRAVRNGHLTISDVDRYALSAGAEPLLLSVTCAPLDEFDVKLDLQVDGTTLASSNAQGRASKESLLDVRIPAGRTVVITVASVGDTAMVDARYELSWTTEPAPGSPGTLPGPPGPPGEPGGVLDEYNDQ